MRDEKVKVDCSVCLFSFERTQKNGKKETKTNKQKNSKKQEFSSCSFVRMRARCSLSLGRLLRTKLDEERELLYRKKHTC